MEIILNEIVRAGNHIKFEHLNMSGNDLSDFCPEQVASAICQSRIVQITNTGVDPLKLFKHVITDNFAVIEEIHMNGSFTHVPVELFHGTLSRLKKIFFEDITELTEFQFESLVEISRILDAKIAINLRSVATIKPIFAGMFYLKKTTINVEDYSHLSAMDWNTVMECSAHQDSKLTDLTIDAGFEGLDLTQLSPKILSGAFSKLECLCLASTKMSKEQYEAIFKTISVSKLELYMLNLNGVDPEAMTMALSRCKTLSMEYVALTHPQWERFLSFLTSASSVAKIKLSNVDLSFISEEPLTSLISKCSSVDLSLSRLTSDQVTKILKKVCEKDNMHYLNLSHIDLSTVPETIIARALINVTRVGLNKTKLTNNQMLSLLVANLGRSKLRTLDLSYINLSKVNYQMKPTFYTAFGSTTTGLKFYYFTGLILILNAIYFKVEGRCLQLQSCT